jgi:WD40 repeat protein
MIRTIHGVSRRRNDAPILRFIHQVHNAKGQIRSLRFSPDGNWLIVSTEHESIWDSETGELLREMPHSGQQQQPDHHCRRILDVDSEGCIWALVSKHTMRRYMTSLVRYAPNGKDIETLIADLETDLAMRMTSILSADRRLLAFNTVRPNKEVPWIEIEVWDVESGRRIKRFAGHYSAFKAMSFSPDGKWLASMGFPIGLVRMWSLEGATE